MTRIQLKETIKKLPAQPGIYFFTDGRNKSLYIGKALNLKNRIGQYLKTDDARLNKMLSEAKKINFIKTGSDIEALILESQYIKEHQPRFNIMMRDDKQYAFVGFTAEEYPKIFITHQPTKNQNFIGPFTDVGALRITLRYLRRIFPYCTCVKPHNNFCLNYHIGKCLGVCCLKQSDAIPNFKFLIFKYRQNINAIRDILSGKKNSLLKKLEKEMEQMAKNGNFKKAIEMRNRISKLKRIFKNAQIIRNSKFIIRDSKNSVKKLALFKELAKILKLNRILHRIEGYDISNIQGEYATGAMVVFEDGIPARDKYRKFKIRQNFFSKNLGGQVKTKRGDVQMLAQILERRFHHPEWPSPDLILIDGGKGQLNAVRAVISNPPAGRVGFQFSPTSPRLGRRRANFKQIQNSKFQIPIIALTKDEKHRGSKIYVSGRKDAIVLSRLPVSIKNFLLQIDSEAHKFAIGYYRKLHIRQLLN